MAFQHAPVVLRHGERFGQLSIISKIIRRKAPGKTQRGPKYLCRCDCGSTRFTYKAGQLMRGEVKHCGRPIHRGQSERSGESQKEKS